MPPQPTVLPPAAPPAHHSHPTCRTWPLQPCAVWARVGSKCSGAGAPRGTQRCRGRGAGLPEPPFSSKVNHGLKQLGGLQPALTQPRRCGCSVFALLNLAGAGRGLDELTGLHSAEQGLPAALGPWLAAGGAVQSPACSSAVSIASCPPVPQALLLSLPPLPVPTRGAGSIPPCQRGGWESVHGPGSSAGSGSCRKRLRFARLICTPASPSTPGPALLRGWHEAVLGKGGVPERAQSEGAPRGGGDPALAPELGSRVLRWLLDGRCSRLVLLLAGCLWQPRASFWERSARGEPQQGGCEPCPGTHGCPSAPLLPIGAWQGQPRAPQRIQPTPRSHLGAAPGQWLGKSLQEPRLGAEQSPEQRFPVVERAAGTGMAGRAGGALPRAHCIHRASIPWARGLAPGSMGPKVPGAGWAAWGCCCCSLGSPGRAPVPGGAGGASPPFVSCSAPVAQALAPLAARAHVRPRRRHKQLPGQPAPPRGCAPRPGFGAGALPTAQAAGSGGSLPMVPPVGLLGTWCWRCPGGSGADAAPRAWCPRAP